jgi:Domain of unknown function (DUF4112)
MAANVALEAVIGMVPVLGDFFDFVWQANIRNLRLVEHHYRSELAPRSLRSIWLTLAVFSLLLLTLLAVAVVSLIRFLVSLF